jgi:hypothetical protein
MAHVTLKFVGRFLQVVSRDGSRKFLAPNFAAPFNKHDVLMTIRHDHVKFFEPELTTPRTQMTTLDPKFRTATLDPQDKPFLAWDLNGLRVGFDVKAPVTVQDGRSGAGDPVVVTRLEKLESLAGRTAKLNQAALNPGTGGPTNAVIEVTAGRGTAKTAEDERCSFSTTPGPSGSETAKEGGTVFRLVPAEIIEFQVDLPNDRELVTFTLVDSRKKSTTVTVRTDRGEPTVVFSNLCPNLHKPDDRDLEFGQYYNLLETPPPAGGFLPTRASGSLSESMPCTIQASFSE